MTPTLAPTAPIWVAPGTPIAAASLAISTSNSDQVVELARWGRGVIVDLDLSADGHWLAVAAGSAAYVHKTANLNDSPLAVEAAGNVSAVSIAPEADKVALVLQDGTLEVWQLNPRQKLFVRDENFSQVQFAPTGNVIAAIRRIPGINSYVDVRDSETGELLASYQYRFFPNFKFSPDGSRIAVWSTSADEAEVYDWQENVLIFSGPADIHPSTEEKLEESDEEVSYQPVLRDVVFVGEDALKLLVHEIRDYTFLTGRVEIQEVRQDESSKLLLALDSIGWLSGATKYVCNEPVFYWDAPEPAVPQQMELANGHQFAALRYTSPSFVGDLGEYSSIRFYRVADGNLLYAVEEGIVDFVLSSDGETWIAGLQDGRLQVRQISDGSVLASVDAYESPLRDLTISSDDQWVGAVYLDEVKVYRREDGSLVHRYPANDIAFAPDVGSFALGYEDGRLEIRNMSDGSLIKFHAAHEERITAVHYTPSGDLLSAGFDCQLTLWQTPNLASLGSLENVLVTGDFSGEQVPMRIREFLNIPDGQAVIGLFFGGEFVVWSLPDGTILRAPQWERAVNIQAVSGDGRYLAVPSYYAPNAWDENLTMLEVEARSAAFSPDASLLVSGQIGQMPERSLVGAIQLWQTPDMTLLHVLTPQTASVTAIAFTHNGKAIISAALDGVIRLWGIPK